MLILYAQRQGVKLRSFGWFTLLFLGVFALLAFREPNAISKPSFVAEDGFAFFKQSYEEPFSRIVFRPHAGYIQLVQRLIAESASFFPLEYVPLAYGLAALVVATMSMTFFALPSFRAVIQNDALRAIVVLTLPFMPNAGELTRVCAVHWYLLFFLVLVSIMPVPKKHSLAALLWVAAAGSFWSQPVAFVCIPILFYRLRQAARGAERRWWLALTVVAAAYPLTAQSQSAISALWHTPNVLLSLWHAIGYRVFCFFVLGQETSRCVLAGGWLLTMRLSMFCLGLCAVAAWWPRAARPPQAGFHLAVLSYYVLLLPVPYLLRVEIIPDFVVISQDTWLANQRYFCVPVLLLCVLIGVACQGFASTPARRVAAAAVLLGWLGLHTPAYRLWNFESHPGWPHFARHVRRAEERVKRTGVGERIAIQTTPFTFVLDVGSPPPSAQPEW